LFWTQTSEYIFWSFWRIWTKKAWVNTFRSFYTEVKLEYWEVKKSHWGKGRRES
jgi:hypothetical protein